MLANFTTPDQGPSSCRERLTSQNRIDTRSGFIHIGPKNALAKEKEIQGGMAVISDSSKKRHERREFWQITIASVALVSAGLFINAEAPNETEVAPFLVQVPARIATEGETTHREPSGDTEKDIKDLGIKDLGIQDFGIKEIKEKVANPIENL
ncbi:MAG: hypothetical protein C5B49_00125 [Bdellovibrio sp.]|nr:MAG: hypothetical protein C5B49_00125 [Bdellovibrio sp.]